MESHKSKLDPSCVTRERGRTNLSSGAFCVLSPIAVRGSEMTAKGHIVQGLQRAVGWNLLKILTVSLQAEELSSSVSPGTALRSMRTTVCAKHVHF